MGHDTDPTTYFYKPFGILTGIQGPGTVISPALDTNQAVGVAIVRAEISVGLLLTSTFVLEEASASGGPWSAVPITDLRNLTLEGLGVPFGFAYTALGSIATNCQIDLDKRKQFLRMFVVNTEGLLLWSFILFAPRRTYDTVIDQTDQI